MPKIESVLKSEISRMSKREVNAAYRPLAGEVRAMKKKLSDLLKRFTPLEKWTREKIREAEAKKAQLKAPAEVVKKSRMFTPVRIKNLRLKLGLSQRELGILTGATLGAVGGWESGRFVPRKDKKAAMLALKKLGKREVRKVLEKKAEEAGKEKPKRKKAKKPSKKATKKKAGRKKPGRPAKKKAPKKGARKTRKPMKKKAGRPRKAGAKRKRAGKARGRKK